jgi:malate dehydrogenase
MKISIIGAAGYVGSNVALTLALDGLANEIVLVDPPKPNVVAQLAMDTGTAAAEKGVAVLAGDFPDIRDSDIVIVTAGAAQGFISSRLELLPKNLPIIRDIAGKIKDFCPEAVVITATNPVDPLNYAMYRYTGFDRFKVIGYSNNDSIRFRVMVARALGREVADIEGMVLGEHGENQVPLFSSVKIKGQPVHIDNAVKQEIRSRTREILQNMEDLKAGRTAGVTTAVGMKEVVGAIAKDTGKVVPCALVLQGEYGLFNVCMGVPAALGRGGVRRVVELDLAPDEEPYLAATLEVLRPAMQQVDNYLGGVPLLEK